MYIRIYVTLGCDSSAFLLFMNCCCFEFSTYNYLLQIFGQLQSATICHAIKAFGDTPYATTTQISHNMQLVSHNQTVFLVKAVWLCETKYAATTYLPI